MRNRFARKETRLTHIADLCLAQGLQDGMSTWEALLDALDQAYDLAVSDCAKWVRDAEGDGVAEDLLTDAGIDGKPLHDSRCTRCPRDVGNEGAATKVALGHETGSVSVAAPGEPKREKRK